MIEEQDDLRTDRSDPALAWTIRGWVKPGEYMTVRPAPTVMMFSKGKLVGGTVDTLPHLGKTVEAMTSRKR